MLLLYYSPEVIWREALPQRKESLVLGNLRNNVQRSLVLRFAVHYLHTLDSEGQEKLCESWFDVRCHFNVIKFLKIMSAERSDLQQGNNIHEFIIPPLRRCWPSLNRKVFQKINILIRYYPQSRIQTWKLKNFSSDESAVQVQWKIVLSVDLIYECVIESFMQLFWQFIKGCNDSTNLAGAMTFNNFNSGHLIQLLYIVKKLRL